MDSFKCSKCSYNPPRNYDLTRHLKRCTWCCLTILLYQLNQHSRIKSAGGMEYLDVNPRPEPGGGLYTKEEFEEAMSTIRGQIPHPEL